MNPEDIDYDAVSESSRRESKIVDQVCSIIENYAIRDPKGAPHKLHIHFFESPVELLGEDGRVTAIRTERTKLDGNGGVVGTGKFTDWPVGAVYRAVGYRSTPCRRCRSTRQAVIPNEGGRVDGHVGLYATRWVRRGPSA